MIGKMSAIVAAAACADAIVTFMPGFAPPVAAHAAQPPAIDQMAVTKDQGSAAAVSRPACVEVWPYYERACLYDARQPDGRARAVRVVSIERTARERSASGLR
jgi:hypothetical protein